MKNSYYFLLAILIRLLLIPSIVRAPLWYDENYTLLMIHRPLLQMLQAAAGDVHPPLYYLLLWPLGIMDSMPAWAIRIPSLVFSIAALFVWWRILDYVVDYRITRDASWVLFAISSTALYYTGEGRMYSLLILLVLLCVLMLLERRWVWLCICSVLMLWTHNYGVLYLAALWLAGLTFQPTRRDRVLLTVSMGLAGFLFSPWLAVMVSQMGTIQGNYWLFRITPWSAIYALYQSWSLYGKLINDIYGQVVFIGWLAFALGWNIVHKQWIWADFRLACILGFGPFLLAVILSLVWQPMLLYRALTPSAPFICLLLCVPLTNLLRSGNKQLLLFAVFVIPYLVINPARLYVPGWHLRGVDDTRILQALQVIEADWQPGDQVLHIGDGSLVDMLPYTTHPGSHYKSASCGAEARGSLSTRTRQGLGIQTLDQAELTEPYWLMTSESPMTPACEIPLTEELTRSKRLVLCIVDNDLARSCLYR